MDEDVRARLAELLEEIETSTFRETRWGRRGYSERDVDEFLDYLVDVLFHLLNAAEQARGPTIEPPRAAAEDHSVEVEEPQDTALLVLDDGESTEPGTTKADAPGVLSDQEAPAPEPAAHDVAPAPAEAAASSAGPDDGDERTADAAAGEPGVGQATATEDPSGAGAVQESGQPPPPPWVRPG